MTRFLSPRTCLFTLTLLATAGTARAGQAIAAPPAVAESTSSDRHEVINEKDHHFLGRVEFERGDTKIFADEAWFYGDTNRFIASGNVVFSQGGNRISADRADFDTKTRLGTFQNAYGIASVKPPQQQMRPGAIAPPSIGSQETDVYFFGEKIEKIGPKKYRITKGGFTTCVQPTPRWDLHAGTVVLNIDHYTLLRNAVLRVKGVPMLYVPLIVYPTKKEDRATGFLIPTYGSSSLRGQQIHNAFFWAINRSQDATVMHEWYSKTGQGVAGEYRYNLFGGDGQMTTHFRKEHAATYSTNGSTSTLPASRTYELRGAANQMLPGRLRARARVDYFSDLTRSQTYNADIYSSSRNQRTYGVSVVGAWGTYLLNGTFDRREIFYNTTASNVGGSAPRVSLTRNERPLFGSPAYFSMAAEYANVVYESKGLDSENNPLVVNKGLARLDVTPQIRYPFKKWQWFTVNSTFGWRDTYYTRSQIPATRTTPAILTDDDVNRRFYTAQAQIVGPVFNRIWDTPDNGYAEKFKHTVEPSLHIQRTSSIDNRDRIIQLEGVDFIVGGTTQLTYGLTNRFFAKRRQGAQAAAARQFADVAVTQSYYTDERASQYDPQYSTSFSGAAPSHFSPISLSLRALPNDNVNASMRAEFDSRHHSLRTISANVTYVRPGMLQTGFGWSKKVFIKELAGFNDPNYLDHSVNASAAVHTRENKYGSAYSFNYDVLRRSMLQQRISGYYNAQCCGIAFEYQTYNFNRFSSFPVPADRRFFMSFTLAGLGNFSPFNGAMGGVPR